MFKKGILTIVLIFLFASLAKLNGPDLDELAKTWANTKLNGMTDAEKVGQLFMLQAYSNKGTKHINYLKKVVEQYHIGGLAFFQGSPDKQIQITSELQEVSKIPMLIAIDAEWGLGMRLDNSISFPRQMTLGAIQDNRLIYDMGRDIGKQLKRIGVHLNFAPVVDINSIANNPVIHDRSFGQDKKNVSRKAYAYMKGMQDEGILACAKHFPGHGSTEKDSHKTLPILKGNYVDIHNEEIFPFRLLFKQGIKSVMTGHLHVPVLDNRKNRPASLSEKIVQEKIREEMEYDGLIITDALEMKGVSDHFKPGEIEVEAFLAGNDILTISQDFATAYAGVLKAVKNGRISQERLNASVMRILMAKFEVGLFFPPELKQEDLSQVLLNPTSLALKEDLYRNAITLLKSSEGNHFFIKAPFEKIAVLSLGSKKETDFQKRVKTFCNADSYNSNLMPSKSEIEKLKNLAKNYDQILIGIHSMNKSLARDFGINANIRNLIRELDDQAEVSLAIFGSPYSLRLFDRSADIIMAYEDDPMAQDMAAQALFGAIDIKGKLPVDGGLHFKMGDGTYMQNAGILAYSLPEKAGLNSDTLDLIEDIVNEMIETKAAPGCQVLIAKDGKIVYDKSFGYHTYNKKQEIRKNDVFDLASVTKVMATTLATMKLYEQEKVNIFKPIDNYVNGFIDTSDKKDITVIEALTHHAGLKAWIPFYRQTLDTLADKKIIPSKKYYSKIPIKGFSTKVAAGLFIQDSYKDTISSLIYGSPLRDRKDYKYSDLGLYMVKDVVDATAGMPMETFLEKEFYQPLGLQYTGYNPTDKIPKERVVPTEEDKYYRNQRLQGYVHDMGAAMLGGVSGHAGLFSNSKDLAVLMQMLLNKGVYNNKKYFDHKTIYTFTTRYHRSSRRGIGFDMKELDSRKRMNMSELAPASTFGHLGFTGTCVFADPDNNIVYIFLSNRTYPTMNNSKFVRENYRSRVQSVIYKAFIDKL